MAHKTFPAAYYQLINFSCLINSLCLLAYRNKNGYLMQSDLANGYRLEPDKQNTPKKPSELINI